jgi:uncharacterized membrane protein
MNLDLSTWWFLGTLWSVAFLFHLTPRLARPEVLFGVTVRPDFRDSAAGRSLTRKFRYALWGTTALLSAAIIAGRAWKPGVVPGVALPSLVVATSVIWYFVHRMARPHAVRPTSEREAMLTAVAGRLPGNWLAKLGPFLMLGGVMLYLHLNYEALPDPFPVQWNIRGEADRFVEKSPAKVFQLPVMALVICGTMALTGFSISRHSKRISIRGTAGTRESKFRAMNLWILLGAQYYIACLFAWITIVLRSPHATPLANSIMMAMAILPLPLAIYLSVRYGQGGSRLGDARTTVLGLSEARGRLAESPPEGDRTPDTCWKLGQVYYNPGDAAIWVEKRAGVGYTLNFGRPSAWLILLLMLFGPLLVIALMRN